MAANTIHNGCAVEDGPDNKIWVTMGDANHPMRAQDPDKRTARCCASTATAALRPTTRSGPATAHRRIVYSIGHRNPQGITFEPGSGRVYAAEHGPEQDDEINLIGPGRNYGWPCVTGNNHSYQSCPGSPTFTAPAWSSEGPTLATSGGAFVTGSSWEGWNHSLFVSTLKESDLRRFTANPDTHKLTMRSTLYQRPMGTPAGGRGWGPAISST